jgi:hypothetical protein
MAHRAAPLFSLLALVVASVFATADAPTATRGSDPGGLIVHEWGTFTSIAGADGNAVDWAPLQGPSDLPCFVDRHRLNIKGWLRGTVRMETPVIYFYAPQATDVNVHVRFRQGLVTEWFPKASVTPVVPNAASLREPAYEGTIEWADVKVRPGAKREFPTETGPSHYYAARDTDAAPIEVGSQKEGFLFYRGVGRFRPPIAATINAEGQILARNPQGEALGDVILFENRGGSITHHVRRAAGSQVTLRFDRRAKRDLASLDATLETMLVAQGLYRKEAAAMIATWRDSWFEEGTRLFYFVPKPTIDSILPLDVKPAPTEVARAFVGRLELVTSAMQQDVKDAILATDRATLRKYGRLLGPILQRLLDASPAGERMQLEMKMPFVYSSLETRACQ